MTDCELFGHPLVDGVTCPCGQRHHRFRTVVQDPTPYPYPPQQMLFHLERRPACKPHKTTRETFRPAAPVVAAPWPDTYRQRRARAIAAGLPSSYVGP